VLRLWVASQDYRNDIVVSEERLKKVSETYRGIRNTLRYQLSNLYDFEPTKHAVPDDRLTGLDRWILSEFSKLEAEVARAYDAFEFHAVYQKISQFVAVELSAIYHDIVKDRLYTLGYNDPKRRSTQTALYRMVVSLCQMLGPILSFTADEAWEFIPGKEGASVHLANGSRGNLHSLRRNISAGRLCSRHGKECFRCSSKCVRPKSLAKRLKRKSNSKTIEEGLHYHRLHGGIARTAECLELDGPAE